MNNTRVIDSDFINSLSYTDFVGIINQWNVPPGAYSTINKWSVFGHVDKKSHVLEVACTTGFSIRELSILTGCSGVGFDLSGQSIESAIKNKTDYALKSKLIYECADGYKFNNSEKFSHIILGASLRFFPDPRKMLEKTISMLQDPGIILSCEFYVAESIPKALVHEAKQVFGIDITQQDYKEVMKIYSGLELIYEDRNNILEETETELKHYCMSTTLRACKNLRINDDVAKQAIYDRIYTIKKMSNKLRPYQNYNVLVHRYRGKIYPDRFTELF